MDLSKIIPGVMTIINDGAPIVEELVPAWAPAINIASKILAGAAQAEPTAVALVTQIQDGQPPTPAQLQSFATDYETAYQALHADLTAQIAAAPT